MTWRLAKSLLTLQAELNKEYPKRTKPDWTIGDQSHKSRASDHNPNDAGVVCAMDVREGGGIPLKEVAETVRKLIGKHPAVKYVIHDGRIAGTWTDGKWTAYSGPNAHETHVHVSVGTGRDGKSTGAYDSVQPWGIGKTGGGGSTPPAKPKKPKKFGTWYNGQPGTRKLEQWDAGNDVHFVQKYIGDKRCGVADGYFGPQTKAGVKWYQEMRGIKVDGIVGPVTWRNMGRGYEGE